MKFGGSAFTVEYSTKNILPKTSTLNTIFSNLKDFPRIIMLLRRTDRRAHGISSRGLQEFFLKKEKYQYTNRDGGVGDVEDGAEELQFLSADKRHPGRPSSMYHREVEHIDYASMQER